MAQARSSQCDRSRYESFSLRIVLHTAKDYDVRAQSPFKSFWHPNYPFGPAPSTSNDFVDFRATFTRQTLGYSLSRLFLKAVAHDSSFTEQSQSKRPLTRGGQTRMPVPEAWMMQHRKYARIKKILNIGEKLKPLGLESSSNYDNQSQARDQPDEAESAVPKAEHITQDNAHSEAINRNLQAAEETRDLYIHVQLCTYPKVACEAKSYFSGANSYL